MKREHVLLLVALGVLLMVGVAAVAGVGIRSQDDSARPPCDQLPTRQTIEEALASNDQLASRIRGVGSGVTVNVATPCNDDPERAILRITYSTDSERDGVNAILTEEDGFGVEAELIRE